MLKKILGKDIAGYISPHKRLIMLAIILTALSSLLIIIPVYLLQPFVDEGMKMTNDPVEWKIPWITFQYPLSFKRTELVLVSHISPNGLLVILTAVAFISVVLKSVTIYFGELAAVAFSNRSIRELRVELAQKFISLPLSFYHKRKIGELRAYCKGYRGPYSYAGQYRQCYNRAYKAALDDNCVSYLSLFYELEVDVNHHYCSTYYCEPD